MTLAGNFFRSTIGRKFLAAASGVILIVFITAHLVGNLQVFEDPDRINGYAEFLRSLGPTLWIERAVLLLAAVIHIWATLGLAIEDRKARGGVPYRSSHWLQAAFASRYMRWTGLVVLAFVLYHLAQFTWGVVQTDTYKTHLPLYTMAGDYHVLGFATVRAGTQVPDVHAMVIRGFENPIVAVFYIIAIGLLSLHLLHGAESLFQTFGWRNSRWSRGLRAIVTIACVAYFLGNLAIPGAVLTGRLVPDPLAMAQLEAKIPAGPLADKWRKLKAETKLVNPANKRKYEIVVVGAGLAGASAASSLADLGYKVKCFVFHDSPRRAHSIAAQGGINAAKNYANDGDSVYRLFYDTIKGGDYRSREANTHRLAEISVNIIDQCAALGVPFAREYGGLLATRSFGGAQVSRTFYARGQTGQQLLLGAYSSLSRAVGNGSVELFTQREMLDLVVVDGHAKGIVVRNLVTGEITRHAADAVVLASGGYGNVFNLSTYARGSNATAIWRAYKRGACFANPCYTQIHPTCIRVTGDYQSKLTLMSESLRNDGRIWVPKKAEDRRKDPQTVPEADRDYYLERMYPAFGNLSPRDIASRAAKRVCDEGRGVGETGLGVYLDFADAIKRLGEKGVKERYGNLFDIYHEITHENAYRTPMRIFPAVHYTMGGLWVDYNLMSNVPGLFVLGEANFSDHGANRLGASALMQGLADGFFVIPYTIAGYLAEQKPGSRPPADGPAFRQAEENVAAQTARLLGIKGKEPVSHFHKRLGHILWQKCGMARNRAGLEEALQEIPALREQFWRNVNVPGSGASLNQSLEQAGRVADFLELGELMCRDALTREESCGCHFREEFQYPDGECKRNDEQYAHVAAWEYQGEGQAPRRNTEPLNFEFVHPSVRSYK